MACGLGAYAFPEFNQGFMKEKPAGVGVVKFPCISKIDTTHILKAFQLGAEGVIVAGCAEDEKDECPFQKTMYWGRQRVSRVKNILKELELEEDRLALCALTTDEVANFADSISETMEKMKELGGVK